MNNDPDIRTTTPPAERGTVEPRATASSDESFLDDERMNDLRTRWSDVQAGFVDDPRKAVGDAQQLVGSVVDELTSTFQRERDSLEGKWNQGDTDTEALRVAFQRYRSFFDRLLST